MSILTVGMKAIGMKVKPSNNKNLLIQYFSSWDRTPYSFAFFFVEKDDDFLSHKLYKNTINFCLANNIKLVIVSKKQEDIIDESGFRIIPYRRFNEILIQFSKNCFK